MTQLIALVDQTGTLPRRTPLQFTDCYRTPGSSAGLIQWHLSRDLGVQAVAAGGSLQQWTLDSSKPALYHDGSTADLDIAHHAYVLFGIPADRQVYAIEQENWPAYAAVNDAAYLCWADPTWDLAPRLPRTVPANGVVVFGNDGVDFHDYYSTEADGFLGEPESFSYKDTTYAQQSFNIVAADMRGNVVVINHWGALVRVIPANNISSTIDITATLYRTPGVMAVFDLVYPNGIACDGTTWYVLVVFGRTQFVEFQPLQYLDLEQYVLSSTDLLNWRLVRKVGGYGDRTGALGFVNVDPVFNPATGNLTELRVTATARFADGTTQSWSESPLALDSTAEPRQTLYGNTNGTLSFGSGDVLLATLTLSMPSELGNTESENVPDYRDVTTELMAEAVSGDGGGAQSPFSPLFPLTVRSDIGLAGFHGISDYAGYSGFVFKYNSFSFSGVNPYGPFVTNQGLNIPAFNLPPGWVDVKLVLFQNGSTGQGMELLAPDNTVLASQFQGGVPVHGFEVYIDYPYTLSIDVEENRLSIDYLAWGIGPDGTILIVPQDGVSAPLLARGSSAPLALDTTGVDVAQNPGRFVFFVPPNNKEIIRFSQDVPSSIWTSTQDRTDVGSVGNGLGFIDPDGKGDLTAHAWQGVAADGRGGLYSVDQTTGNLWHRAGGAGTAWTSVHSAFIPAGDVVILLTRSRRTPGSLVCVHGPDRTFFDGGPGDSVTVTFWNITTHEVTSDPAFAVGFFGAGEVDSGAGTSATRNIWTASAVEVYPGTPLVFPRLAADGTGDRIIEDGTGNSVVDG